MKLSELSVDRGLDVLANIIQHVTTIAADPEVSALFSDRKPREGETEKAAVIRILGAAVPKLLTSHRAELIDILAELEGVSAEEYVRNTSFARMLSGLYEMITDEELAALFTVRPGEGAENSKAVSR